jgi:pseudouridine synthase
MKLMLFLSHNGVLSRRKAFDAVKNGAVTVNGTVDREPSTDIDPSRDKVCYHDRPINNRIFEYLILNKPEDYVTTCATQFDQKTVMELLPKELRHLRPVGRLDKDTEGLLLFTNDGELANQLAHPAFDVDKTYFARVRGLVAPETAQKLEDGVIIDERKTAPAGVEVVSAREDVSEIRITLHEGRKHQVRLMCDAVGHTVVYLKRLRQGPLELGFLKSGEWRRLTEEEAAQLKSIKRSIYPAAGIGGKKDFKPRVEEKQYVGRRGRGEYQRDKRRAEFERPAPSREAKRRPASSVKPPFAGVRRESPSGSRGESSGRPVERPSRPRGEYRADQRRMERPRAGSRDDQRRAERPRTNTPRPEYSSKEGHRSQPRPGDRRAPAAPKPLFSSHSEKRRFSSTREWHSDSDVHAPKAGRTVRNGK